VGRRGYKTDLVHLFELASGHKLGEYLRDRAKKKWAWAKIAEEMNGVLCKLFSDKLLFDTIMGHKLFRVSFSNLSWWYKKFGIISKVKRGPKKKGVKND
jgi:hypothetical protein